MAGDSWRDKGWKDNCIGIKGFMGMNEEIEDEGWRQGDRRMAEDGNRDGWRNGQRESWAVG